MEELNMANEFATEMMEAAKNPEELTKTAKENEMERTAEDAAVLNDEALEGVVGGEHAANYACSKCESPNEENGRAAKSGIMNFLQ